MAIKETPVNFRTYYRLFIESNKQKLEDALKLKETLKEEVDVKHTNVSSWAEVYEKEFGINLFDYIEFKKEIGKDLVCISK